MEAKKINVLGTVYTIAESNESEDCRLVDHDGFCDTSTKECVIDEMKDASPDMKRNITSYKNSVKRHELIHAFLYESGLDVSSWAQNEEMVDWIAIQFPKLLEAFKAADVL